MKLDRTTTKLLKFIHNNPFNQSVASLRTKFSNFPTFIESYQTLLDEKLIINRNGSVMLTNKGQDFFYEYWKSKITKFLTTFIIPIAIAVISSFFTAHLISDTNNCNCVIQYDCLQEN